MRKEKLQPKAARPFKPAGWLIVDRESGLLLCFGRNRRVVNRRVYEEQGGVLELHAVAALTISYRLLRYLEQNAHACCPEDWTEIITHQGYADLAPDEANTRP